MLLIKNGRVVDPVTGVDEVMDVLIEGAHIEEVGHNLSAAGAEVIDAAGLVVARCSEPSDYEPDCGHA